MGKVADELAYKRRIIDDTMETYLTISGAICIEGPKWCGKTWTSSYHAKSEFLVGDPSRNFSNRQLAELNPLMILQGETPRMIDEWQEVPSIWDATRAEVDKRGQKGQIILTGSSTPKRKGILHSGTGRIVK
nr:AAA family ATPase [Clostridia bacterium]